ncbi:MAG: Acetobutylicum phosphotransbutyrylase [Thermoleophilia bacterium]|nr:Acetobutylicum phosphotransbutyrylase [Thermoleophilia bacterium]
MPVSSNHAPTPFRRAARFVAVLAWCALIYAASDRPDLRVSSDDLIDFVLRKAAHVVVFGVLLVLVERAVRRARAATTASVSVAWVSTFAYACSDEWHQTFVRGRVGHPRDVMIDMIGATTAAVIVMLLARRPAAAAPSPEPELVP